MSLKLVSDSSNVVPFPQERQVPPTIETVRDMAPSSTLVASILEERALSLAGLQGAFRSQMVQQARLLEIARAVLVGGLGTSAAASRFHTSRQRVHGIVRRVQAAIQQVPSHWKRVEVWLPPKLAERVKRMAREALADWRRRKAAREARPRRGTAAARATDQG